ncbi:hypothetical protein BX600DRAFT_513850 [Xylariales sp. PMI_506]|nr:hypothetical protein BX600DRAFT_513850 [Xylariales sp. PMI_506]
MVGVPGRSKGCNTCVQRKIKCDQLTPTCGNCQKSNRLCTGYKRKLAYVFSKDVKLPELAGSNPEEATVVHHGRWRKAKAPQPAQTQLQLGELLHHGGIVALSRISRQVHSETAWRQQFHYLFLDYLAPSGVRELPRSVVSLNWLFQMQEGSIQSPALEASIAAFSAARIGRIYNDPDLVHQSRSVYMSCLERLRYALSNPQTRLSEETLAACVALSLYELTEATPGGENAFAMHQRGAMSLLELRGASACASPLSHDIFLGLRSIAVTTSLINRSQTFLSRPEWNEEPWKVFPKTPFDKLTDQLLSIPPIHRQYDELRFENNINVLRDGLLEIIAKFRVINSKLRSIYRDFEISVSGPLYSPELSKIDSRLDNAELGKVYPVSLYFPAFYVAQFTCTYWSAVMAVEIQLDEIYFRLAAAAEPPISLSAPPSDAGDSDPSQPFAATTSDGGNSGHFSAAECDRRAREHSATWKTMARNICQSTEFFLQPQYGGVGALTMLSFLGGCISCMQNSPQEWSREIAWILDWIIDIKSRFHIVATKLKEN